MNKWFYLNFTLLLLAIWKVLTSSLHLSIVFGMLGFLFILFNWTRHAVFSTLRSSMNRQKKVKYANLSKRVLPFHKWTGSTALLLIIVHAILIVQRYGLQLTNIKMVSGFTTIIVLLFIVITGWLRLFWPSRLKRMIHLYLGISLFFLIIIHLIAKL